MMEYTYTNLPRYEKLTARENVANSVVEADHVLLFSEEAGKLTAKLPDGSFVSVGGGGGTGAFYQCASVDTAAGTWTGYKWELNEEGGYALSETLTTDELTVMGFEPAVGTSYSADTLIMAGKLYAGPDPMPSDGLVFYAPLTVDYNTERGSYSTVTTGGTFADNALSLNGSQYVEWTGDENIPSGTSAMSIAGRVYIANIDDSWTYFFGFSGGSNGSAFGLNMEYESLACRVGFDWKYLYNMQTGVWYHLALTRSEGGEVTAYVDGVSVGTTTTSNSVGNSIITVGANGGEGYSAKFAGSVSSFRIYNRELTAEEVFILANEFNEPFINIDDTISLTFKPNEPISYSLDAKDSLGNACAYEVISGTLPTGVEFDVSTGTFSGTPTAEGEGSIVVRCYTKKAEKEVTVTVKVKESIIPEEGLVFYAPLTNTSTTAETGQTLNFSGDVTATTMNGVPCLYSSEAYIASSFTTPTTFTVCFWCKPDTGGGCFIGIGSTEERTGDKSLSITPDSVKTMEQMIAYINQVSTTNVAMDFYAWSYTNGSQTLWKNNEVIATSTYNESNTNNSGIRIRIQGYVSASRVYNRVLTGDEITELYNEFKEPYIGIDDAVSTMFKLNESGTYALNAVEYEGATSTPTGNTVKYALVSSDLPSTITFDEATGTFSGTSDTEATYTVVVRCYVEGGAEKTVTVTIKVSESTLGEGLVFHAPLATDASTTTGQTLTTQGTIEYTTVEGVPCAYFNGDSSCLYNFDFNSITGTNAFSFGTWIKSSEYTSQAVAAIGYIHYNRQSCEILAKDGGAYFTLYTSDTSPYLINFSSSNDGNWHHLFFVYENGTRKTYFDGILANTDSNTDSNIIDMTNGVVIGSLPNGGQPGRDGDYFTGYLAGFRVYDRVLTSDEVTELADEFTPTA